MPATINPFAGQPGPRPRLTLAQAAKFTRENVLARVGRAGQERDDPWEPENLTAFRASEVDFLVDGAGECPSVQAAVDAAIAQGRKGRVVIAISAGTHEGLVYLPAVDGLHFTLVGLGDTPSVTELFADIDAEMPSAEYAALFGAQFSESPAVVQAIFDRIAARQTLSTANASVLRVESNGTQIINLTIRNSYNANREAAAPDGARADAEGRYARGQHQAVALLSAGADRLQLERVHLKSYQDTLYLQSPDKSSTVRSYLHACDIEGDVDFIFGQATAYFYACTVRSIGARGAISWAVAPATHIETSFGFVFEGCTFTHDGSALAQTGLFHLGRQWFEGVRASPYKTLAEPDFRVSAGPRSKREGQGGTISSESLLSVGKCVLLNCTIGTHINPNAPWDDWSGPSFDAQGLRSDKPLEDRFRPAQTCLADMTDGLAHWADLGVQMPHNADENDIWLGEYNSTTQQAEARS